MITDAKIESSAFYRLVHVYVLVAFGLAQPIYDLLARHPEFFVAHRTQSVDIIVTALIVSILLPLVFALPVFAVGCLHRRAGTLVQHGMIALLATLFSAALISDYGFIPAPILAGLAMLGGLGFACLLYPRKAVRMALNWASPAILVFPLLFLFFSPVKKLLTSPPAADGISAANNGTPVVMLVLDELPLISLLDPEGDIDHAHFPNFHALSRDSLWFPNATTVAEHTTDAIPALLTGRYPDRKRVPDFIDHPTNLFTLLSSSHDLSNVNELMTSLCPDSLCWNRKNLELDFVTRISYLFGDLAVVYLHLLLPVQYRVALPPIHHAWDGFLRRPPARPPRREKARNPIPRTHPLRRAAGDRPAWFMDFLDRLEDGDKPGLHFTHVMLPHYPWRYLPDGRRYSGASKQIPGLVNDHTWTQASAPALIARQRHLLQLGLVDTMIGALIERLRETGLYEKSLLIVVADHGVSFLPGAPRRQITQANAAEILYIPLFIKPPFLQSGKTIYRQVELVDVMPTIADILQLAPEPEFVGRSLSRPAAIRTRKHVFTQQHERMTFDIEEIALDTATRRQFENGAGDGDRYDRFRLGSARHWVGMPLAEFAIQETTQYKFKVDQAGAFGDVKAMASEIPAMISGQFTTPPGAQEGVEHVAVDGPDLLIAINGTLAASVPSYISGDAKSYRFASVLPPHLLRDGRNELGIFIRGSAGQSKPGLISVWRENPAP